ncbi:MAG: Phosphoserine phosphatase [Promethearchaeota archaeon]|nr:MAG: Phosphoserine phosphatase [Candidatus Lokiarchaeota archaeon]
MRNKKVCCWDLEGPLSVLDFAAEMGKKLGEKSELGLQNYNMGDFFFMISKYDDYLIDTPGIKEELGIPEYQPGDTLRIMAPMYVACFSNDELIELAKSNLGILPGIRELINILRKDWEVFVISTSYTQFAYQVTKELEIPQDHVYCTEFPITQLKELGTNIQESVDELVKEIYKKYTKYNNNLKSVLEELNTFFWSNQESDYIKIMNQIRVRGGKRKENAVEEISERTSTSISRMIAIGDSITDINMLERLNEEGGIAVSFNGNRFSLQNANIAITTPNGLGVLPIFEHNADISQFLSEWEKNYSSFKNKPAKLPNSLLSTQCLNYFQAYDFMPKIYNLKNKSQKELNKIVSEQEEMRKQVRGWAGKLG